MSTFAYRVVGAALLDGSVYEAVETDRRATGQAVAVVLLTSLVAGVGAGGWQGPQPATLVGMAILTVIAWFSWAVLILQVGGRWLRESETDVNFSQLIRTVGFAAAPGLLQFLAFIPPLTVPIFALTWVWMFAAMVVAVRHALDFHSTWRAILVCWIALGTVLALTALAGLLLGPVLADVTRVVF